MTSLIISATCSVVPHADVTVPFPLLQSMATVTQSAETSLIPAVPVSIVIIIVKINPVFFMTQRFLIKLSFILILKTLFGNRSGYF
ncbi:hypothetical protein SAMN05444380_102180 [Thermophagus xiamenensis]|uniref:Uncharacterized protein n=1 Tax=Thermophagus xiamenensis TaxID=385682 RepID=A0A1I1VJQ8_9BACT|nr:hypothetical protein SAMN05444380_102180 [Thermophagus xiamenensis]